LQLFPTELGLQLFPTELGLQLFPTELGLQLWFPEVYFGKAPTKLIGAEIRFPYQTVVSFVKEFCVSGCRFRQEAAFRTVRISPEPFPASASCHKEGTSVREARQIPAASPGPLQQAVKGLHGRPIAGRPPTVTKACS